MSEVLYSEADYATPGRTLYLQQVWLSNRNKTPQDAMQILTC